VAGDNGGPFPPTEDAAVTDDFDEFSFLPEQAADVGAESVPPAARVSLTLADGRVLSALRFGEHPPQVTFLHGAGLNAHTWDRTVLALGLPALVIDLPGHGDSSWRPDAAYTPGTLAPDVVAGLDAWTDRSQLLVGQSLGGLTAAAVAAARPDLARALIVVDITPGVDPSAGPSQIREFFAGPTDWASRDELVERALAFGLGGSRASAERGVFLNSRVRADGRVEWKHHFAHLAAARAAAGSDGAAAASAPAPTPAATALRSDAGWADVAGVTASITLVRGDRGYVTEADAADFSRRVPAASVITVPSGHNVQEERPAELAHVIAAQATAR
jgi:pimeloyl-ACP methyl ester carboxylesterase